MKQTFKPILFNTEMVQAILQGRKTQTRRTRNLNKVNQDPDNFTFESFSVDYNYMSFNNLKTGFWQGITNAIGVPGDILWVRETFESVPVETASVFSNDSKIEHRFKYKADNIEPFRKWKPSIHMPKAACRIFLKITDVRVERIQDITEEDAKLEGVNYDKDFYQYNCYLCDNKGHAGSHNICEDGFYDNAKSSFQSLWESINSKDSWELNPWVWVISFERVTKPEGFNEC